MPTLSQVWAASVKLQRAREHGEFDPVSGYSVEAIVEWLHEAEGDPDERVATAASAALRRAGLPGEN